MRKRFAYLSVLVVLLMAIVGVGCSATGENKAFSSGSNGSGGSDAASTGNGQGGSGGCLLDCGPSPSGSCPAA